MPHSLHIKPLCRSETSDWCPLGSACVCLVSSNPALLPKGTKAICTGAICNGVERLSVTQRTKVTVEPHSLLAFTPNCRTRIFIFTRSSCLSYGAQRDYQQHSNSIRLSLNETNTSLSSTALHLQIQRLIDISRYYKSFILTHECRKLLVLMYVWNVCGWSMCLWSAPRSFWWLTVTGCQWEQKPVCVCTRIQM